MSDKDQVIKDAARRAMVKEAVNFGRFGRQAMSKGKDAFKAVKPEGKDMAFPKVVGALVAAIGVGQFVKSMISYAKEKNLERKEPKYYKSMIQANPDLMNEDPQEVMDLWSTLYHHSPHMAQDPISAGAFITQNIQGRTRSELGGPTVDAYKTLNSIESDAIGSRERRFGADNDATAALLAGLGLG